MVVMFSFFLGALLLLDGALSKAIPPNRLAPSKRQDTPIEPADSNTIDCLEIIAYAQQGERLFWASDVFDCLKNVPFNPAVAERFIDYYNETLQFQTTLAFLADPPAGYQQPPVDVLQVLQEIRANATSGVYKSQYVFEAEVQLLVNRMHDGHTSLNAGILSPFTFVSPYSLVSASVDGKSAPRIFLADHVHQATENNQPSPVEEINGVDVVEYLTRFAELNSEGYLEPHADWNAIMDSPARDIQGYLSIFQRAMFYPGDELNFKLANDTIVEANWWALYHELYATGPLTTGGDFYNYFVLGILPDSYNDTNPNEKWWPDDYDLETEETTDDTEDTDETEETNNTTESQYGCSGGDLDSWCLYSMGAYPDDPVVSQYGVDILGSGIVTGYLLDDISTGVLSIPSFYQTGGDIKNFTTAVREFVDLVAEQNTSRVIIDLQQNSGGMVLLALTTFKEFFFDIDPYTGSRIRSHELANVLGSAYSQWWESLDPEDPLYLSYAASEWVATNRINPLTGQNFTSWAEYHGQVNVLDDSFSEQQIYNLSDRIFDKSMFDYVPRAYAEPEEFESSARKWNPEEILILTDGLCSSTCALFVEFMAHQAGVRTISVGGRPIEGPMQTVGGNRGATVYTADRIDYDILALNDTLENEEAFSRTPDRDDTGMWINYASVNIRDQMRKNDTTPLQFKYEASQCRIYYTLANVYNMSQLWRDAAAATWDDPSLCVENSIGYATGPNVTETQQPPERTAQSPTLSLEAVNQVNFQLNSTGGLEGKLRAVNGKPKYGVGKYRTCSLDTDCFNSDKCKPVPASCQMQTGEWESVRVELRPTVCVSPCTTGSRETCGGTCRKQEKADSKSTKARNTSGTTGKRTINANPPTLYHGFCEPVLDARQYNPKACERI
ncbi:hypothetical protein BS50DRAFT_516100 [Corynespora cassiicola Philippines]|uniref:CPAF-like PDZ domain-containing protein n=1 Tax=Corynespora cassiicola Philippines TaxID=1448308 RepID=A0A2T2P327_CORCC|nr:hypothetical protein BS50DRAFT_516100 [Corynespora cassiicola Philippines]